MIGIGKLSVQSPLAASPGLKDRRPPMTHRLRLQNSYKCCIDKSFNVQLFAARLKNSIEFLALENVCFLTSTFSVLETILEMIAKTHAKQNPNL